LAHSGPCREISHKRAGRNGRRFSVIRYVGGAATQARQSYLNYTTWCSQVTPRLSAQRHQMLRAGGSRRALPGIDVVNQRVDVHLVGIRPVDERVLLLLQRLHLFLKDGNLPLKAGDLRHKRIHNRLRLGLNDIPPLLRDRNILVDLPLPDTLLRILPSLVDRRDSGAAPEKTNRSDNVRQPFPRRLCPRLPRVDPPHPVSLGTTQGRLPEGKEDEGGQCKRLGSTRSPVRERNRPDGHHVCGESTGCGKRPNQLRPVVSPKFSDKPPGRTENRPDTPQHLHPRLLPRNNRLGGDECDPRANCLGRQPWKRSQPSVEVTPGMGQRSEHWVTVI